MTAPPLEKTIVATITKQLRARGVWVLKTVGGHGRTGLPDLLLCFDGRFVAIEVKRPGAKVTARQDAELRKIRQAGGLAAVVTSWEDVMQILGLTND